MSQSLPPPADVPAAARAHLDAGTRLFQARDLAGALREYHAAAALAPENETILSAIGTLAMSAGDWTAGERIHRALETRFPGRHTARLALSLFNLGRYDEALPLLSSLVERGSTDLSCVLAYAACLERTGSEQRGVDVLESVYRALPTAESAVRLASAYTRLGMRDRLDERLPQLLAEHPGNAALLGALSEHALNSRDYARGFDLLEHRWACSLEPRALSRLDCPAWDGTPFGGELLVTAEQGLGDEILASSMFGELASRGQRARIACEARLLPVFRRSFPGLSFCDRHSDELAVAARNAACRKIEALQLGRWFRRDAAQFPDRSHWLQADTGRAATLRARLAADHPGKRLVGISWRSARALMGNAKSAVLPDLEPLLRTPGCVFIDMQYGDTTAERDALRHEYGLEIHHLPDLDLTQDIDGLFALADALDAIVSTSNTTVHVGGALGKPVYAMIPGSRYSLWYWGYEGDTTPWYPSVRMYRGPARRTWHDVASEVAAALAASR